MTQSLTRTSHAGELRQPWLSSAFWDILFIVAPAYLTSAAVLLCRGSIDNSAEVPLWAWVGFILCIDVAHVYATLFRTYLNKTARAKHGTLLVAVPVLCWAVGCLLYSCGDLLFWRVLAYLAVFHFIRQQWGFVALYSRNDPAEARKLAWADQLLIYMATGYPLLFWHTNLPRQFNWFVPGDFIGSVPAAVASAGLAFYVISAAIYAVKEIALLRSHGLINIPKNLLIAGTALSWWVGIVTLNSDLAFTITNVVSHGVPYMALIWLYQSRHRRSDQVSETVKLGERSFPAGARIALGWAPAFFFLLVILAYLEEGLWDGFVWREHLSFFAPFAHLPIVTDSSILALLIPLLALPQSTHYVLDGFIWRVRDRQSVWSA